MCKGSNIPLKARDLAVQSATRVICVSAHLPEETDLF